MENSKLIVGCSILIFCVPTLQFFLLLATIGSATLEFCHFAGMTPRFLPRFRLFVARLSTSSAAFLIGVNMLLRVCKTIHVFFEYSIYLGLQRFELRYLSGIVTVGIVILNGEIVQAACLTIWNVGFRPLYNRETGLGLFRQYSVLRSPLIGRPAAVELEKIKTESLSFLPQEIIHPRIKRVYTNSVVRSSPRFRYLSQSRCSPVGATKKRNRGV